MSLQAVGRSYLADESLRTPRALHKSVGTLVAHGWGRAAICVHGKNLVIDCELLLVRSVHHSKERMPYKCVRLVVNETRALVIAGSIVLDGLA